MPGTPPPGGGSKMWWACLSCPFFCQGPPNALVYFQNQVQSQFPTGSPPGLTLSVFLHLKADQLVLACWLPPVSQTQHYLASECL